MKKILATIVIILGIATVGHSYMTPPQNDTVWWLFPDGTCKKILRSQIP